MDGLNENKAEAKCETLWLGIKTKILKIAKENVELLK